MTDTTCLNSQPPLYPTRTRRNFEESDGTVIFSLNLRLSGCTKLTLDLAHKLGKPVLHIYDTRKERISNSDLLRLEIQALTEYKIVADLVVSNTVKFYIDGTLLRHSQRSCPA